MTCLTSHCRVRAQHPLPDDADGPLVSQQETDMNTQKTETSLLPERESKTVLLADEGTLCSHRWRTRDSCASTPPHCLGYSHCLPTGSSEAKKRRRGRLGWRPLSVSPRVPEKKPPLGQFSDGFCSCQDHQKVKTTLTFDGLILSLRALTRLACAASRCRLRFRCDRRRRVMTWARAYHTSRDREVRAAPFAADQTPATDRR